jgi:TPP-dependent 2-oxoacid decarboxylase
MAGDGDNGGGIFMHDRDDDIPKSAAPAVGDKHASLEKLETVAFHLTALYQRLSQDRDSWAVTGGDLAEAVQALQAHIKESTAFDEKFQQQLVRFIQQETKKAGDTVALALTNAARESTTREINTITERLGSAADNAVSTLFAYKREVGRSNLWLAIGVIMGAMFGGAVGAATIYCIYDYSGDRASVQKVAPVAQEGHRRKE